ncbi:DUF2062 domain-containing protein [Patescibacteria group bacterium]|nr:DUF2062 domain-containing protein [Patescibacteria group bacterium]
MTDYFKSFLAKIKTSSRKFFLINDTPQKIAVGFALGVFLGTIPGGGLLASLIVSSLLGLNRLAAISGALATNLWLTMVILPLAAKIGTLIFGEDYQSLIAQFQANYHLGYKFFLSSFVLFEIALPLAVGFVIIALLISFLAYIAVWFLMENRKMPIHKITRN